MDKICYRIESLCKDYFDIWKNINGILNRYAFEYEKEDVKKMAHDGLMKKVKLKLGEESSIPTLFEVETYTAAETDRVIMDDDDDEQKRPPTPSTKPPPTMQQSLYDIRSKLANIRQKQPQIALTVKEIISNLQPPPRSLLKYLPSVQPPRPSSPRKVAPSITASYPKLVLKTTPTPSKLRLHKARPTLSTYYSQTLESPRHQTPSTYRVKRLQSRVNLLSSLELSVARPPSLNLKVNI